MKKIKTFGKEFIKIFQHSSSFDKKNKNIFISGGHNNLFINENIFNTITCIFFLFFLLYFEVV